MNDAEDIEGAQDIYHHERIIFRKLTLHLLLLQRSKIPIPTRIPRPKRHFECHAEEVLLKLHC